MAVAIGGTYLLVGRLLRTVQFEGGTA